MVPSEIRGPDLDGVVADANAVGLPYVVIGGFAVIAHGYFRATKDSDLLVPDGAETDEAILRFFERIGATRFGDGKVMTREDVAGAHHLRVDSRHGVIDTHSADSLGGEIPRYRSSRSARVLGAA